MLPEFFRINEKETLDSLCWYYSFGIDDLDRYKHILDWQKLSINYHIDLNCEILEKFKDYWDWNRLSIRTYYSYPENILEQFSDRWDWYELSGNKAIKWTIPFIEKFENYFDWNELCYNNSLPWGLELLEKYEDNWNWFILCCCSAFNWTDELFDRFRNRVKPEWFLEARKFAAGSTFITQIFNDLPSIKLENSRYEILGIKETKDNFVDDIRIFLNDIKEAPSSIPEMKQGKKVIFARNNSGFTVNENYKINYSIIYVNPDAKKVDLANQNITSICKFGNVLKNLEYLDLRGNRMADHYIFWSAIINTKLEKLNYLDLSGNPLRCFPEQVLYIPLLKVLKCSCKSFEKSKFPKTLPLAGLRELHLSNFSGFNNAACETIFKLSTLEKLVLKNGNIEEITNELSNLVNLKYLELTNLTWNSSSELIFFEEIGNLNSLESLIIEDNDLKTLPDIICELPNLKDVRLKGNGFLVEELSPKLQKFLDGKLRN